MRRASKVDANQAEIVRGLRKCGCSVLDLSAVGKGCSDLLVNRGGTLYMLEVKDGTLPPSKGRNRRTPHQRKFHKDWPVHVVCTVEEALKAVGL